VLGPTPPPGTGAPGAGVAAQLEEPPRPGPLYAVEVSHEHNRKVAQGFVDGRRVAMVDFVH